MKVYIEEVHDLSNKIKKSTETQQQTTQEIYEATETLNAQGFLISQLVVQQKSNIDNTIKSLDELYTIIQETKKYSDDLPHITEDFDIESENINDNEETDAVDQSTIS
jgi:methyl-accepting chemotaxis protein